VPARGKLEALRRGEARLWTGPAAHFLGGALDFLQALGRYALVRLRLRRRRPPAP
jgi:hypothetical protein